MEFPKAQFDKNLLSYCGLYCKQCSFKSAYEEQNLKHLKSIPYEFVQRDLSEYNCESCKGRCICGPCKIRPCASAKNIDSCADCGSFPCELINSFENDGLPHHKTAIENLNNIRKYGVESWFETLIPKLRCSCGEKQSWYYTCPLHK